MPSHREIAEDWGVSSSYVDSCVRRGCPTDTFENARLWRIANSKGTPRSKPKKGVTIEEQADMLDMATEIATIEEAKENVKGARIALIKARQMLNQAFKEEKVSKINALIGMHWKCMETWVKAEGLLVEKMKAEGLLVPLTDAMQRARKGYEIIIQRMTALPQNIAFACNPHDPAHAMDILQNEMTAIIAEAQKAVQ